MGLFDKILFDKILNSALPPEFDPGRLCGMIRQLLSDLEEDLVDVYQDKSEDRCEAAYKAGLTRLEMANDKLDLLQEGLR